MKTSPVWIAVLALCACGGGSANEGTASPANAASAQPSAAPSASAAPTASATTAPTASAAPTASPAVAITPMRFVASAEGQNLMGVLNFGFKTLELNADGSMAQDGRAFGAMRPDAVAAGGGMLVFYIAPDGTLTQHLKDHDEYAKLTADGVQGKDGLTMKIADDGAVTLKRPSGETVVLHGKFDAIPPGGKQAAALMIMSTRQGLLFWSKTKLP